MIKKMVMLVVTLVAFGCFTLAAAKTFTGTVSDSNCGVKHAKASATRLERETEALLP